MKLNRLILICMFQFFLMGNALAMPQRIVSLKPNITEILFALGVGDRVVGVTKYCDYPKEVAALPKVGDYTRPYLEPIIALIPDIVIGSKEESSKRSIETLQNMGIQVLLFPFGNLNETIDSIRAISKELGVQLKGSELANRLEGAIKKIEKASNHKEKIKVLAVLGHSPLIVAGQKSYIGDILNILGVQNVVASSSILYPRWAYENVISTNPDVILDFSMGSELQTNFKDIIKMWQNLKTVNAVQNNRIYSLNLSDFRQSPRVIDGIEKIRKLILENK